MKKNGKAMIRLVLHIVLIALLLAPAVYAAKETVTIAPEQVRVYLQDFLKSKEDHLPQAETRFKSLDLPEAFTVPAGKLSCEILPSDPRILPSRRFTLIFRVDGQVVENFTVRGELEALASVVVAAGDLPRGTILSEGDLNVSTLDLNGLRNPCFDPVELIGKKVKRSLRMGDPLDRAAVEFPPMVRRGDVVSIEARKGGLLVTARGLARQDGQEGDTITVRNSNSQRDILCRVVSPGTVEVDF